MYLYEKVSRNLLLIILNEKEVDERLACSLHSLCPLPVELDLLDPLLKLGSVPTVKVFNEHIVTMPTILPLRWRQVSITTSLQIVSYGRDQCAIHHDLALRSRLVLKNVRASKPGCLQMLEIAHASLTKGRLQLLELQDGRILQLCVSCIRYPRVLPCTHSHHVCWIHERSLRSE